MAEKKPSRDQLIRRRDEINVNWRCQRTQRIELDRDPEEQAIEIEQGGSLLRGSESPRELI